MGKTASWICFVICVGMSMSSWAQGRGMIPVLDRDGNQVALYKESHALVIGISDYTAGWSDLTSIPRELEAVKKALTEQGFQVHAPELSPTSDQLRVAIRRFINNYGRAPENRLLFFFAGHGHTLEKGYRQEMGYIVPADAPNPNRNRNGFLSKAISMNQVVTWAREIDAKHALFIFDSCFSGSVFAARNLPDRPPHISRLTSEPVRQFITAGSAGETVPAQSTFTPAFVDALRYALGDLDDDGYVTGMELGFYLQGKVPQHVPDQTPQFGKIQDYELQKGDFVFKLAKADTSPEPMRPSVAVRETAPTARRSFIEPEMVKIPNRSYAMGRYEVTFDEYDAFAKATGRDLPDEEGWGRGNRPVINVSWHDATEYAGWLSKQTGKRYRLPTEREWDYANRAGSQTAYWWGDQAGTNNASCRGCGSRWTKQTAPVGSFKPNSFGLYDTLGNVWEWVEDCAEKYCAKRVFRGGSWNDKPGYIRSASRFLFNPDYRSDQNGFRLAQDL